MLIKYEGNAMRDSSHGSLAMQNNPVPASEVELKQYRSEVNERAAAWYENANKPAECVDWGIDFPAIVTVFPEKKIPEVIALVERISKEVERLNFTHNDWDVLSKTIQDKIPGPISSEPTTVVQQEITPVSDPIIKGVTLKSSDPKKNKRSNH